MWKKVRKKENSPIYPALNADILLLVNDFIFVCSNKPNFASLRLAKFGVTKMREIRKEKMNYFKCEQCGLLYKEKIWAVECEKWCENNKSCNINILQHAAGVDELGEHIAQRV